MDTWIGSLYQMFETFFYEVDEFVIQDTVGYVGESVKKLYSDVVQDIIPPFVDPIQRHVTPLIPSERIDLVETVDIKENTVDSNTNNSEKCHEPSTSGLSHSEELSCDNLKNKTSENYLYKKSFVEEDSSVFQDADWGIEDIIDLTLSIDSEIEVEPFVEEKKTPLNSSIDEFDLNIPTINRSSELEISDLFLPAKLHNASRNHDVKPNAIYCNPTESMGILSVSSHGLSSCDNNNDFTRLASSSDVVSDLSFSEIGIADGSMVDSEDLKMDTIDLSDKEELTESCVVVEGEKLLAYLDRSRRSKSYKKMIQGAFTSKKRLTNEYKQLAILYGDIDKEFSHKTGPKSQARYQPDSEWELL